MEALSKQLAEATGHTVEEAARALEVCGGELTGAKLLLEEGHKGEEAGHTAEATEQQAPAATTPIHTHASQLYGVPVFPVTVLCITQSH